MNTLAQNILVLASGNQGKLVELNEAFADLSLTVQPQSMFDVPDVPEDGLTFIENALIKARHASRISGFPALADDSGLCVDALDGAPGLYSARFAGTHGDHEANIDKLLQSLTAHPDTAQRQAHFHCTLALVRHAEDPDPIITQGRWFGHITHERCGHQGFGYDPVFVGENDACTAAELSSIDKKIRSHRGQAVRLLKQMLAAKPL